MTARRPLTDAQVSRALRAHFPERAQAGLREQVLRAAETTTQQRPLPSLLDRAVALRRRPEMTGGGERHRWAWVLAAALLTLVAASAMVVGSGRPSLPAVLPTAAPTEAPTTPSAIPSSTPAATPPGSASASPQAGRPPVLTWTQVVLDERSLPPPDPRSIGGHTTRVAWLGDRFVLVTEDPTAVSMSPDGVSWTVEEPDGPARAYYDLALMDSTVSWDDDVVGWNAQEPGANVLRVIRPPAAPTAKTDFDGRVGTVGIGPEGIVAHVHSGLDFDAWVTSVLGPNWVEHMSTFAFVDGTLLITTDDDRKLEVDWAAEGFEPGDVADRGFGWYSRDGNEWTPIPDFPPNVSEIVGVSDGFIARGGGARCDGCDDSAVLSGIVHSPDGQVWRAVDPAAEDWNAAVLPWNGGALVSDGARQFDLWTAQGVRELPMAAELPAAWGDSPVAFGSGPLGLVSVGIDQGDILFSPDGVDWSIEPMPAAMAGDEGARRGPAIAVGEQSVVVLSWAGEPEAPVPSLWYGSPVP